MVFFCNYDDQFQEGIGSMGRVRVYSFFGGGRGDNDCGQGMVFLDGVLFSYYCKCVQFIIEGYICLASEVKICIFRVFVLNLEDICIFIR